MSYTILAIQNFVEHRTYIPAPPTYANDTESTVNEQISIRDELSELLSPMRMRSRQVMKEVEEQMILNQKTLRQAEEVDKSINFSLSRVDSTEKSYDNFQRLFQNCHLLQKKPTEDRNLKIPLTHRQSKTRNLSTNAASTHRASTARPMWRM